MASALAGSAALGVVGPRLRSSLLLWRARDCVQFNHLIRLGPDGASLAAPAGFPHYAERPATSPVGTRPCKLARCVVGSHLSSDGEGARSAAHQRFNSASPQGVAGRGKRSSVAPLEHPLTTDNWIWGISRPETGAVGTRRLVEWLRKRMPPELNTKLPPSWRHPLPQWPGTWHEDRSGAVLPRLAWSFILGK